MGFLTIGVILFGLGILGVIFGVICLIIGAVTNDAFTKSIASRMLLYSAIGLLVSFTLCSIGSKFS